MVEIFHNNMPGQHLYTLLAFLAFSTVFYMHVRNTIIRSLIAFNAGIFVVIAVTGMYENITAPNDFSRGYCAFFLTIYTLVYLYYLFKIDDTRYLQEYPMFWICMGILTFFTGHSLYAMMKQNLIKSNYDIASYADLVHAALNIIANCLYAQSFRCLAKQKI